MKNYVKIYVMLFKNWKLLFENINRLLGSVWYMYLKIKNCCLKIFLKIYVGEKVYENRWNIV